MATDPMNPSFVSGMDWSRPQVAPEPEVAPLPSLSDAAKARLETRAEEHKAALSGQAQTTSDALERAAMVRQEGLPQNEGTIFDKPFADRFAIYGEEATNRSSGILGESLNIDRAEADDQGYVRGQIDNVVSAGKGVAQGIGSLATLGAGLIKPEWGVAVAEGNQATGEWIGDLRSDEYEERERLMSLRNSLHSENNERLRQQDIRDDDSNFIAGLKKIGRDVLSTGSNLLDSPEQLGGLVAEGIGSLGGSVGLTGLGAKLVSKGITKGAANEFTKRALNAGILGGMEGGDAYGNAVLEVMGMSEKTLTENSEEYRKLRDSGLTHEEAQIELADSSGKIAAAVALPIGAVAGAAVGKFEVNPFHALREGGSRLKDIGKTIITQGVEETVQEGGTQFGSNVGLKWSGADPEKDITEGVGESAAMGGLAGAGMGGGLRTVNHAVKLPFDVAKGISKLAEGRINNKVDQNFEVSDKAVEETLASVGPAIEEIRAQVSQPVTEPTSDPEQDDNFSSLVQEIQELVNFPETEVSDGIRGIIQGRNRVEGLYELAKALDSDMLTEAEKIEAALFMKQNAVDIQNKFMGGIHNRVMEADPNTAPLFEQVMAAAVAVQNNKRVAETVDRELTAEQIDKVTDVPELNQENANTPEVQRAIRNTISAVEVAPANVDATKINRILNSVKQGIISLDEKTVRFLEFAADLNQNIKEWKDTLDTKYGFEQTDKSKRTSDEALIIGRSAKEPSLVQHIENIIQAVKVNNTDLAKARLDDFRMFAEGMTNKLNAIYEFQDKGDKQPVPYATRAQDEWLPANHERAKKISQVTPRFARMVERDAKTIQRAYERMAEKFPELEAPALPPMGRRKGFKDLDIEAQERASIEERNTARQSLLGKINNLSDKKDRIRVDQLTPLELDVLKNDFQVNEIGRVWARIPDRLVQYAAENMGSIDETNVSNDDSLGLVDSTEEIQTDQQERIQASEDAPARSTEESEGIDDGSTRDESGDSESATDAVETDERSNDLNNNTFRVYHGTNQQFDTFKEGEIFWTNRPGLATQHAVRNGLQGARVIEADVSLENPGYLEASENDVDTYSMLRRRAVEKLFEEGHDGVVITNDAGDVLVISSKPEQVKQVTKEQTKKEEPEKEEPEQPKVTLSSLVPEVHSNFTEAYELRENGSSLLSIASPIQETWNRLKEAVRMPLVLKVWNEFLNKDSKKIIDNLNNRLKTTKNGQKLIKMIKEEYISANGNTVYDLKNGRQFAFIREINGVWQYDPKIMEIARIAVMDFILNDRAPDPKRIDEKDAASTFKVQEQDVTPHMLKALKSGIYIEAAVENLARMINDYLGVQPRKDVTRNNAGGVTLGLATELMASLIEQGIYQLVTNEVQTESGIRSYRTVKLVDENTIALRKGMTEHGQLDLLSSLLVPEAERETFVGEPPTAIARNQMKNGETALSSMERKAIKNEQNKPAFMNIPVINMMMGIGKQFWLETLGWIDIRDESQFNKNHLESIRGKNISLENGWDKTMGNYQKVIDYATSNNMTIEDVPTYNEYGISKVGRLQERGFGGQGDKQAREAISKTLSVVDLNDPAQEQRVWLAIAQSLGVKTEKMRRDRAVGLAQRLLEHDRASGILSVLTELALRQESDPGAVLNAEEAILIRQGLSELLGLEVEYDGRKADIGEITPKVFHALMTKVQMDLAKLNGNNDKFRTFLSLESDGKTDGPINSIMNFSANFFSATNIRLMTMGGFFLNKKDKTLNSYFEEDGGIDLYEHTANIFQNLLVNIRNSFEPNVKAVSDHAMKLLNITGNVKFDGENITIKRGATKNPLTVSGYGGGAAGISGKIAKELLDSVYERLTGALQGTENKADIMEMLNDVAALVNNNVYYNRKKLTYVWSKSQEYLNPNAIAWDTFELTPKQYKQFSKNIQTLYGNILVGSINNVMIEQKRANEVFIQTTSIQATVAQEAFAREVEILKKTKKPGEDLSEREYSEVLRKIAPYGAQIYMTDQTANIGVSERLSQFNIDPSKSDTNMTESLDDTNKLSGNLRTIQPSKAGVKVAPFMVIMTGDGYMILKLASNGSGLEKTLMVFDGIEMAIENMDEQSREINRIVSENWMTDNSEAIADSFENFIRMNPFKDMDNFSGISITDIDRTLGLDNPSQAERTKAIKALNSELREISDMIRARKETLNEVPYSVDHMASAEQPWSNDVPLLLDQEGNPLEEDALAEELNKRMMKKLEAIKASRNEKAKQEPQNETFVQDIWNKGKELGKEGDAISLDTNQTFKLLNKNLPKNSYQRVMLQAAMKVLRDSGYMFHFGSPEELTKLRYKLSPPGDYMDMSRVDGQADTINKHIYIAYGSAETILHEMIHAAVADKISNAYENPSSVTKEVADAVQRLELLMGQFLELDMTQFEDDLAGFNVQIVINNFLNQGEKSVALNEFVAYVVSNQRLIEIARKTKARVGLASIVYKGLRFMKSLLGMRDIPDNMFRNIAFNMDIIMRSENDGTKANDPIRMLNALPISSPRLNSILVDLDQKLNAYGSVATGTQELDILNSALNTANTMIASGFSLNDQQKLAFIMLQRSMMTTIEVDRESLLRAQELFKHTMANLTPEKLQDDPQSTNPNDIKRGQDRFNALSGAFGFERDPQGNSSLLGSFLALSQVDDGFRKVLRDIPVPTRNQSDLIVSNKFDEVLTRFYNKTIGKLLTYVYDGGRNNKTVGKAIDHLMKSIAVAKDDTRTRLEKYWDKTADYFEGKTVDMVQTQLDKGLDKLQSKNNMVAKAAHKVLSVGSKKHGRAVRNGITMFLNNENISHVIRDFMTEIFGTNEENEFIHDKVNIVKHAVDRARQDYLKSVPHIIMSKFKNKLSLNEWENFSKALAAPDIANYFKKVGLQRLRDIYNNDNSLNSEISRIQKEIRNISPQFASIYNTKAEALAHFMMTGQMTSRNLLRNAEAISRLLGEGRQPIHSVAVKVQPLIDDLVSLLALKKVDKHLRKEMVQKFDNEPEGMDFMLSYISDLDRNERKKTTNVRARLNHIKGRMDTVSSGSDNLIVADTKEAKRLISMGYTRVGRYYGDRIEAPNVKHYYYSSTAGRPPYHQGVLQTVQRTLYGVDAVTGYTVGNTAGRLTGGAMKYYHGKWFNSRKDNLVPDEYFQPIYDENGDVVAFERTLDPTKTSMIQKDNHLATRIGSWKGRQAEEVLSAQYNESLVEVLKQNWDNAGSRRNEYVNIATSPDRVHQYIWGVIPKDTKTQIEDLFGKDDNDKPQFWVRRDMVNDALGYPGASVTDYFTGTNRLSKNFNEAVSKTLVAVFGPKIMPFLQNTERNWQSFVTAAKLNIVVRSLVVPISNIVSNVKQLLMRGVPIRYFGKPLKMKIAETNTYLRDRVRMAEIEAEHAAYGNDPVVSKRLRAEYRSILDSHRRMSIWPLIEKGEFSSIADGLSEADKMNHSSQLLDWVEDKINKLPSGLQTAAKYAIVSKDTALFKVLNRSVQYGDFIAKSLAYDHYISQGKSPEEAYRDIRNEFVNYNLLPGRVRTIFEALGLSWFYSFKIRSVKVAVSMIRDNPLKALMWSYNPVVDSGIPGAEDGVITDNLITKWLEGTLHHTIGPEMITHLWESNTWIRMTT